MGTQSVVADRVFAGATAAMVLPTSIADPPPIATTPATRSRRAMAAAASAWAMVGSL